MYQSEADVADPDFFENQRPTLCDWHQRDPVDSLEWTRSFLIGKFQDNKPNPFVLDCSLAGRLYCPLVAKNCNKNSPEVQSESNLKNFFTVFPNPTVELINIQFSQKENMEIQINLYDGLGRKIHSETPKKTISEAIQIQLPANTSSFLFLKAILTKFGNREVIRKKIFVRK